MGASTSGPHESGFPTDDPRLLSLLPLIYVAWSDSDLTLAEWRAIADQVEKLDLPEGTKLPVLERWLNPDAPPDPGELRTLLSVIRRMAAGLPEATRRSLADLGVELAQAGGGDDAQYWLRPEVTEALADIEGALGVDASQVCRELLSPEGARPTGADDETAPAFEPASMARLLGGVYRETREAVLKVLRDPKFRYEYGLDRTTYRERVMDWCRELARHGFGALAFPPDYGGKGDIGRFLAASEMLGYHDLSLAVKFGVQFGLFGGSVASLGTQRHHEKYLPDIGTLELPGCYAMTEAAHGSNVRDIETLARYDKKSREFVINTPTGRARKVYIGNAVRHGRMAAVFAQLQIDDARYGVHAFLVPIRDREGKLRPGIRIRDHGEKLGLGGVDNGSIWFDHVRIPRENLLNRFAYVSADGVYTTTIPGDAKRFFTMLSTLVGGRISIATAALSAVKSGLTIAVRYGARRRQFGPVGEPEVRILDYRSHQRRLMPPLATTFAIDFAIKHLVRTYLARRGMMSREVEVLAAGLKAYSSWHAVHTLQTCREACGGSGYMAVNRFASLRADSDVFTTFEGDNTVLMQLVAKALLGDFQEQFEEARFLGIVKHVTGKAARAIAELNPIVTRMTDESHLRDPEFQLGALRYRENQLLVSAARRLKKRVDKGMDAFAAMNDCQDHLLALAHAHVEREILEQFHDAIEDVPNAQLSSILKTLRDLFALSRIEADRGWFLEQGYIEGVKARKIRTVVNRLCHEVRLQALPLVNSFAIPDELLGAPIALGELATERPSGG
ncbi:MAG: acyl-CoA dehydrogenase family protein [Gemmatimonadota bacterium]|nr:MAG: acyl-CoA dehydrogenase family protein [Gemmatimonadota bacterium]